WRLSQIRRRRFVLREVEASLASPPPVLVPGKGRLSLLRFRRFWLRRVGAHIALRCRFRSPFSFGVFFLVFFCLYWVKFAVWFLSLGWFR
ncbi:unnamed protein product, partial [Brassica rapa subsp. narinosa]